MFVPPHSLIMLFYKRRVAATTIRIKAIPPSILPAPLVEGETDELGDPVLEPEPELEPELVLVPLV